MLPLDKPVRLVLPPPISVNALYMNRKKGAGRGRIKTPEYRQWLETAGSYLAVQGPLPEFVGPVMVAYYVGEKGIGNMDFGNTEKAITDLLVSRGVIRDDNRTRLHGGSIFWVPGMSGVIAVIEPSTYRPNAKALKASITLRQRDLIA